MKVSEKLNAIEYAQFGIEGTSMLAFRDIPELIKKYVHGTKALDFGCGTGRSTRFLKTLGMEAIGVDKSSYFLDQAINMDKDGKYLLSLKNKISATDNSFDMVFASLVLLMISNQNKMEDTLLEIKRVLKKNKICIIVTGSVHMHSPYKDWVSYDTDFIENYNMQRGSLVFLKIKDKEVIFKDYNWYHGDYLKFFNNAGFDVLETITPMGINEDGIIWKDEKTSSPFIIYVLKKNS